MTGAIDPAGERKSALDAFKAEPIRGLGAGEFATWWTEHGSLAQPVTNAIAVPRVRRRSLTLDQVGR